MMAYFLLSKKIVKNQFELMEKHVDILAYSYKTNPEVARVLEKIKNPWFSLNSMRTLPKLRDKKKILFFLQGQPLKKLNEILEMGVSNFVVDNHSDLKELLDTIEKKGGKITLFLRMKSKEHTFYTGKFFVYGFGVKEINELIPKLAKNKRIKRLGILVHKKTQNIGEWDLKEEFQEAIEKENFEKLDVINIGGGIPIEYVNSHPDIKRVLKQIQGFRKFLNEMGIKLMAEPGRFIAAPAVKLITKVIGVYEETIILDASIYNSSMDTFLRNVRLPIEGEKDSGYKYLIKGCSPDSLDIFRYKVFLPNPVKPGNRLIFLNAGAYNFYTDFNDLPRLKTKVVESF